MYTIGNNDKQTINFLYIVMMKVHTYTVRFTSYIMHVFILPNYFECNEEAQDIQSNLLSMVLLNWKQQQMKKN